MAVRSSKSAAQGVGGSEDGSDRPFATPRRPNPKHLMELYDIDGLLGQGASSTVWRCVHRKTGQVRAMKKIDTSEVSARQIAHEVALMRLLKHDCVVRCYEVFLEAQYVNIVVDMFTGGDLVDGLNAHRKARGRIPEGQLAHLARQMAEAVKHVHGLRIVHRDIKGENFLSDRPDIGDPECRVALADFGTATRLDPDVFLDQRVGTPAFWSPEVWSGRYAFGVDVWALGVTTFILLTGQLPFDGEEDICRHQGPNDSPVAFPYFASSGCKGFISTCLVKEASRRSSASAVAKHPWLSTPPSADSGARFSLDGEQVVQSAGAVVGFLADAAGAVVVGCFTGLAMCLDMLLSGGEESRRQGRRSAPPPSRSATASLASPDPRSVDFEKELTELERQISTTSLQALQRKKENSVAH